MRKSILTEEEKRYLANIAADLQTGNHLIRPRSTEYKTYMQEYYDAVNATEPTEKQREMKEYVHQTTDYYYWKSLPEEERFF